MEFNKLSLKYRKVANVELLLSKYDMLGKNYQKFQSPLLKNN